MCLYAYDGPFFFPIRTRLSPPGSGLMIGAMQVTSCLDETRRSLSFS